MRYLLLCLFLWAFCAAQAQDAPRFRWGGLGYTYAGLGYTQFSDLAVSTSANGFSFGGGGFLLLGQRWILMGQGHGTLPSTKRTANQEISYTYGGGGFNLGYALYNAKHWLAFPSVGLGGSAAILTMKNEGSIPLSFGDQIVARGMKRDFELPATYLDFNFNIHRLLPIGEGLGGFSLGLTAGYMLGLSRENWQGVADLPTSSIRQFYVRICLGGGGFVAVSP
ncbi:MAG: hypothetical protein ACFCUI_11900 [Bernardetiaceae bacterium]